MSEQDTFERIDVDRPHSNPVQLHLHVARYRFAQRFVSGKRALDVACGTGYGTAMLADAGAAEVAGVDLDEPSIRHARQKFMRPRMTFSVGDAEEPPVSGPFEVVVSFETIEHLQRPERFLAAVCRVLTPDGILLLSTPCRHRGSLTDLPQNPFHVREWNQVEFAALLQGYFAHVEICGQFVELAKNWLPLNRTLARVITAIVSPDRLHNLNSCEVLPLENLPSFRLRIGYLVAVCRGPKQ